MSDPTLVARIQEIVATISGIATSSADTDIYEAGFASVDALTLLVELEDAFGITLVDDAFIQARTPAELADLVARMRGETAA